MLNLDESKRNEFGYFEDRAVIDTCSLLDIAISYDTKWKTYFYSGGSYNKTLKEFARELLKYLKIYVSMYAIEEVKKFFAYPDGGNYTRGYNLNNNTINQLYDFIRTLKTAELNDEANAIIAETNKGRKRDFKFMDKCIFMTGFVVSADTVIAQNSRDFPLIQNLVKKYYRPVVKALSYDNLMITNGLTIMRNRRNPPEVKNESSKSMARKILDEIYKSGF